MEKNKYQVWEGEMEIQHLEGNEVTFLTVIFSSILGIMLFVMLLLKTGFNTLFRMKRVSNRKPATLTAIHR